MSICKREIWKRGRMRKSGLYAIKEKNTHLFNYQFYVPPSLIPFLISTLFVSLLWLFFYSAKSIHTTSSIINFLFLDFITNTHISCPSPFIPALINNHIYSHFLFTSSIHLLLFLSSLFWSFTILLTHKFSTPPLPSFLHSSINPQKHSTPEQNKPNKTNPHNKRTRKKIQLTKITRV